MIHTELHISSDDEIYTHHNHLVITIEEGMIVQSIYFHDPETVMETIRELWKVHDHLKTELKMQSI